MQDQPEPHNNPTKMIKNSYFFHRNFMYLEYTYHNINHTPEYLITVQLTFLLRSRMTVIVKETAITLPWSMTIRCYIKSII